MNTITPDGHTVNDMGEWTVDGAAQTRAAEIKGTLTQNRYQGDYLYRGIMTGEGLATMNYLLHIPQDAKENMPLVVYLHGAGAVEKGFDKGIGGSKVDGLKNVPMWFIVEDSSVAINAANYAKSVIDSEGGTAWVTVDKGASHEQVNGSDKGKDKCGVYGWMISQTKVK